MLQDTHHTVAQVKHHLSPHTHNDSCVSSRDLQHSPTRKLAVLKHLTELIDIIERALRQDGMNQTSRREIEPTHPASQY
jgi:hypothetical protein